MSDNPHLEKVYHLKVNPFKSRTDPTVKMAGRRNEREEWTEAVEGFRGGRTNSINFIIGEYGFGKTLSLHKIIEQYSGDKDFLAVFMKMLPEDRVSKFGVDFIQRIFRSVDDEVFHQFRREDLDVLKQVFPEIGNVFARIPLKDEKALFFIRGEVPATATLLKKMGIKRKLDRTSIAMEYLLGFLYLLRGIGKKTLLIGIDEVEYVFSQMRGANISLVFNTLRAFNDILDTPDARKLASPPSNMIFFLAISAGGWKNLNDLGQREQAEGGAVQAMMRRFRKTIDLTPLNKEETSELIEERLRFNRVSGDYEDEPLIPYEETFVDYVYGLSLGNPGEVVKYCDYALEEGIKKKAKLLDRDFAEKAFVTHGLIFEAEG